MPDFYPIIFEPIFKDYVWGGRNLEKFTVRPHGSGKGG